MKLDHLGISDTDRGLIRKAVKNADRVFLAPMDKGLSGSSVWQAKWILPDRKLSKLNVFKIGQIGKIQKEFDAMKHVANSVDENIPAHYIETNISQKRALLHLKFQGSITSENTAFSLRSYIRMPQYGSTEDSICRVINHLYEERMRGWHGSERSAEKKRNILTEVPRWGSKIDLIKAASEIGYDALDRDLKQIHKLGIKDLDHLVKQVLTEVRDMRWGPIHGDLHAANVNLDDSRNVYLIDFGETRYGWRALDFVILEAAIKFAVTPDHAPVTTLIECENHIDSIDKKFIPGSWLYGSELSKIVAAAKAIREKCVSCGAEPHMRNYRAGLICAASAFTSIEWLLNRRFLFHSIAYQLRQLEKAP